MCVRVTLSGVLVSGTHRIQLHRSHPTVDFDDVETNPHILQVGVGALDAWRGLPD